MQYRKILLFLFALMAALASTVLANSYIHKTVGNSSIDSFGKAKKILLKEVYAQHRETFYCKSDFDVAKKAYHTNGYIPKKEGKRANRIEWEHIVPAHAFGQSFPEWREGNPECVDRKGKSFKGRNCAQKVNMEYRYMQADMHNLVPAIGEVNGLRSNYSFAIIEGEQRDFGSCDMEIVNKKAEPPPGVRGDIARTYFYMNAAYPNRGIISRKNQKLFEVWTELDPVDDWECMRQEMIEKIQGNQNSFVKDRCRPL